MRRTGYKYNPKPRERTPVEPDLSRTSSARRELVRVQKSGTPEERQAMEQKVSELHPDMLIDRRRVS